MTKLRIVSIVVLVACGSFFIASRANLAQSQVASGKSYRMVSLETARERSVVRPLELRTRLVKATGEWKEEVVSLRKATEGRKRVVYNTTEGQYIQSPQSPDALQLVDAFALSAPHSAEWLRKHADFVRTEVLLGFSTYVLRSGWIEQYYAPEVGSIPVKVVMHHTNSEQVIEAIQIEFIPVTDEDLAKPTLPVKLDFLATKIEQAERNGQKDFAESLRRIMRESTSNTK